jgi:indolepyruvate ferredoxin oxidoreductase
MNRAVATADDVALRSVTLDDRYRLDDGPIYLSGVQALVRLLIEQRKADQRAGIGSAGFVSGYRGSPLGGVDLALWQAAAELKQHDVRFEPGLNEELAATMVQGSQQIGLIGGAKVAGVFGLWYAKNPGVDRAGDALKHANAAGTAELGGVLAVSGDDPGATSSSIPNQCEPAFAAALIPTLAPASLAEIIELGLAGWAMSRFAGTWVGLKTVADVVESSGTITLPSRRPPLTRPDGFDDPSGPLGIRWPDSRWQQDERLQLRRLPAARAFARANGLDRRVFGASRPRIGIVCAGKPLADVRQALDLLGIDEAGARAMGLALFQVALVWPLEPGALREFAEGLDELIVVEERRAVLEPQIKEQAWLWTASKRPVIVGKADEQGTPLLPEIGVLTPALVARMIAQRLLRQPSTPLGLRERLDALQRQHAPLPPLGGDLVRNPHFCAGCPHARATRVPEGGLAMAGIGCHSLRLGMPASQTMFMVQMGGEGSNWLGAAPFVQREHVFQNLGDGTYGHSGSLAVRAALAAGARMTFRILYNGAVAMTGGQPAEGGLEVAQIAGQLRSEGVQRIAVVAEDPSRHAGALPAGATLHGRDELNAVQRELASMPGVTVLIHDQLCAIEKRRHRRRGELPPVTSRPFINERVCEGCGDCVEQSQCSALLPVDTVLGRKRRIDTSACNVELSCLDGLCPSFVSVEGARLHRPALPTLPGDTLPEPMRDRAAAEIIVHGIGGSGVVTVGALLGMAAHLEGRGCSVLDNTGIARKGGAVSSHVRISADAAPPHGSRIADGRATLVIAADLVGAAESAAVAKIARGRTRLLLNADALPTLNQRLEPDAPFDPEPLRRRLALAAGEDAVTELAATALAERLLGDVIFANLLLLGAAFQTGAVPLSLEALQRAIELNGQDVEANRNAFLLGRLAVHSPDAIAQALGAPSGTVATPAVVSMSLDALVADRVARLRAYQGEDLAARYTALVRLADEAEARAGVHSNALARCVASAFHRLLAVKDEYEVARLYGDGEFKAELDKRFEPGYVLRYHLAPPLIARLDATTGRPRKRAFGPWMGALWPWLARLRVLRGSWLDPFGHTRERRLERRVADDYEITLRRLLAHLTAANHALVLEYAALPERIRGYGVVKLRNIEAAQVQAARILAQLGAASD